MYSDELFALEAIFSFIHQFFWKLLEILGFSICSSFGRQLCQNYGWAGSERYVRSHITEPPCWRIDWKDNDDGAKPLKTSFRKQYSILNLTYWHTSHRRVTNIFNIEHSTIFLCESHKKLCYRTWFSVLFTRESFRIHLIFSGLILRITWFFVTVIQ